MRWCRFHKDASIVHGVVEGGEIAEIAGDPFGVWHRTGFMTPVQGARLAVPVTPSTFYAVGHNYMDHVMMLARRTGKPPSFPERPEVGYRANSALIAHGEAIVKPADAGEAFQYEGELVAVIGRRARNVSRTEALDCIFGWTIGNDVSERAWQRGDRSFWRAKNSDTFKPMGPWIETQVDLDAMETVVRLNGEVQDRFKTSAMIFDAADFITELTRYVTLHPGDVLWLGTDGEPRNMQPGDVCEIELTGIGTLRNRVVAG